MMRGIYIARVDLSQPHLAGVARKIGAQITALEAALGPVALFTPQGTDVMQNDIVLKSYPTGKTSRRLLHFWRFYNAIAALNTPLDYAYIRYQRSSPAFLRMLRTLRRRNPDMTIVVEIPTWPYRHEEASLREKLYGMTDRVLCRFMRRYVDRIVTFSAEPEIMGIPTICTDNGTDVFGVEMVVPPVNSDILHVLGLANLSFWHGYDRVLEGLAAYRNAGGTRQIVFEVVGAGNEFSRLQADTERLGLGDSVQFHGPRFGDDLTRIMNRCHIAISSIGIHRVQNDTSTLKSREFCARGLPFALGHIDRDFLEAPYAFSVPADDTPLDVAALVTFFDRLRSEQPDYSTRMRQFAESHLTWEAKLAPVVEFLHNRA